MAVILMLIYNAECWFAISRKDITELEKMQNLFLRSLLAVGSGCPTAALYSETGTILIEYRILMKKLLFLHHVVSLPEGSLAREVYEVQSKLKLPGLVEECQMFLDRYRITDVASFSKMQWKKLVKVRINELNKEQIINLVKERKYSKIDLETFQTCDFSRKDYFEKLNTADARLRFKIASHMAPTIKMNFMSNDKFTLELWTCPGCAVPGDAKGARDSQVHVLQCEAYKEMREGKNLDCDEDLVEYYRNVINVRLLCES